ncbi:MAG: molybdenum cofactor guanylyltransferase [Candidatus Altiarchaeota archaeon]|nr:molybdenum cofactor guanylyltransferase [Candidatus Altiarchaeota archaeon]
MMVDALMLLGKSKRIRDKPFIPFRGKPLFSFGYDILSSLFDKTFLVCARGLESRLSDYPHIIPEDYDAGPLGAIYAGVQASNADFLFVAGCDMPFLNTELIRFLYSLLEGDGVVPLNPAGLLEPLHAFYRREKVLDVLKTIELNQRITSLIDRMDVLKVRPERLLKYDPQLLSFRSINTLDDVSWFYSVYTK